MLEGCSAVFHLCKLLLIHALAHLLTFSTHFATTLPVPPGVREMLESEGPYVLEVMVPHIEHVLPMIPGGATFKDIITEGDGSVEY